MKRLTLVATLLATALTAYSQGWGYDNNRIAISADGNNADDPKDKWLRADPDDWGGTPVAMAMIAKAGLYDELVHYSYNNFVEGTVAKEGENMMHINAQEGVKRLGFNPEIFFDAVEQFESAKASLTAEMARSTADNPLYFIHMGPSEFFYQCVEACVEAGALEALSHIYVISHSGYNDNHLRRTYHHSMAQAIELSGGRINYKKIKDQNDSNNPHNLWHSGKNSDVWQWLLESSDPNMRWLYDTMDDHPDGVFDISDAGMVYFLLTGDDNGSPSKLKSFFSEEIIPTAKVNAQ